MRLTTLAAVVLFSGCAADATPAQERRSAQPDAVLEGLAVEKFHGDEAFAVVLSDFVNRADVRMV